MNQRSRAFFIPFAREQSIEKSALLMDCGATDRLEVVPIELRRGMSVRQTRALEHSQWYFQYDAILTLSLYDSFTKPFPDFFDERLVGHFL